jgi:hypothetical protein
MLDSADLERVTIQYFLELYTFGLSGARSPKV